MIGKMETAVEQKYVGFLLAGREYAIDITRIVEIIYFQKATPMPDAPDFVEGVVDLRGKVIPVINFKKILLIHGLEDSKPDHILILRCQNKILGFVVDEVREVFQILDARIQSPQSVLKGKASKHLRGVIKLGNRMIFILSMDNLLSPEGGGSFGVEK